MQLTYSLNGGSGGGGGDGTDAVARRQIAELRTALEEHEENKDNPHEVTAEQTGATDGGFRDWKAGRNIALGAGASAEGGGQTTALGANTQAIGTFATAVGNNGTTASGGYSTAVGSFAKATATNAVQLGAGENETEGSLQFRDYTLLTGDGVIPAERLPDAVARKADVKSIRTALAAALAGVSDDMPDSLEATARLLIDLIQSLKSQFA